MALAGLRTCVLDLPRNSLRLQLLGQKVPDSPGCEMSGGTTGLIEGPLRCAPSRLSHCHISVYAVIACFLPQPPISKGFSVTVPRRERSLHLENQLTLSGDIGKGNKLGF